MEVDSTDLSLSVGFPGKVIPAVGVVLFAAFLPAPEVNVTKTLSFVAKAPDEKLECLYLSSLG